MNLNNMDFLSPQITLFFYEKRSHTSKISGLLVLMMIILSLSYISYLIYIIITHQKATSVFFRRFEWEAGYYSLNSSSIFHFIQIFSPESGGYFDEYNPRIFHTYTTFVHSGFKESDLGLYDHWVFDKCRKDIDDKEIDPSLLTNVDNFTNSVCIRYYYNSRNRQYFPIEDKEFIWPHLEHGTARRNNVYLTTIVQKCTNNSVITKIFGDCPSQEEIDAYVNKYFAVYLYFTDTQVDPLNYNKPIQRYLNTITSGIGTKQTFVENYIHFSPVQVRTRQGDFFSEMTEERSFYFDMNRKGAASNDEVYFKIVKYYHLMQNSIQIYERRYSNLFDILPQIGGVFQFLFYIFFWVNYFYNKYVIAYDTNSLFFNVKESTKNINVNNIDNSEKNNNNVQQLYSSNLIHNIDTKINCNDEVNIKNKRYNNTQIKYNKTLNIFKNNLKSIAEKNSYFPYLTNIQEEHPSNLFIDSNPKNDRSNNGLILNDINENNINNQIINNNTVNVFQKSSRKNALFSMFDNKEEIYKTPQYQNMDKYRITKNSIRKIEHQKEVCENLIKEDKMKIIKKFSLIIYIKSLFLKKYKGSADFIIRFRKNLLSEEHFFKSHIKNSLFFKQYNYNKSQYISFIDCFNNL